MKTNPVFNKSGKRPALATLNSAERTPPTASSNKKGACLKNIANTFALVAKEWGF